jgi:hypothetical protein
MKVASFGTGANAWSDIRLRLIRKIVFWAAMRAHVERLAS